MTGLPATGSVRVGRYALEVGPQTGSFAQFQPERERDHARELGKALAEKPEEPPAPVVEALEELEDTADAVTDRIEHASKLFRAAAEGRLLERDLLTGEIGALLGLLQRLDKSGRFDEELRLAKTLHGLLVLTFRWLELVRSLRTVLGAARRAGDEAGQAWALNELGALHLCAGDAKKAVEHLEEALPLEERIGDVAGRCAARHNLDCARRDLVRNARLRRSRVAAAAGALALFLAGGVAGLAVGGTGGDDGTTETQTTLTFTLAVEKVGTGDGTVTSASGAIDCGSNCSEQLEAGSTVTLTAVAGSGSAFGGWEGVNCGQDPSCTVTLDADVTVEPTFDLLPPENATLTVAFDGSGSGSVSGDGIDCPEDCEEPYPVGSTTTLTAVADEGSVFARWEGVECEEGEQVAESCTVTVDGELTATVDFEPLVTLSIKKAGSGTVTSDPGGIDCGEACAHDFAAGVEVTLTAVPDDVWEFDHWEEVCDGSTDPSCSVVVSENVVAVPVFSEVVSEGPG
jgi:hypothetical protein